MGSIKKDCKVLGYQKYIRNTEGTLCVPKYINVVEGIIKGQDATFSISLHIYYLLAQ